MNSQVRYNFVISPVSPKQQEAGFLANVTVEILVNDTVFIRTRGWNIRNGKTGPFLVGPQFRTGRVDANNKAVWVNYVQFWPSVRDANGNVTVDNTHLYKAFQEEALDAYNKFLNQNGASSAPVSQQQVSRPNLPNGWRVNRDNQTGKVFYIDPSGNVYNESDPRLAAILAPQKAVSPPAPAGNPFSAFNI